MNFKIYRWICKFLILSESPSLTMCGTIVVVSTLPSTSTTNPRKKDGSTYYETDLDTMQSKDLSQVTALLASYRLLPGQGGEMSPEPLSHRTNVGLLRSPPPSAEEGNSAFRTVVSRCLIFSFRLFIIDIQVKLVKTNHSTQWENRECECQHIHLWFTLKAMGVRCQGTLCVLNVCHLLKVTIVFWTWILIFSHARAVVVGLKKH